MSEFKFACPVCGQHITADSQSSGTQIECPTCFRKIVVPQAPTSTESKFILSASQAARPRPSNAGAGSDLGPLQTRPTRQVIPVIALAAVVLCAGGAGFFLWRGKVFGRANGQAQAVTNAPSKPAAAAPRPSYPIPTNVSWTMELTKAVIPEMRAAGSIRGSGFLCERATLQGGNLTLRQGKGWPPDLGVTIQLAARQGEELSGKTVEVGPDRAPPVPKVVLRWKNDQQQAATRNFASGYTLRLVFGQAANGRMPGRIYLSLPDEARSFMAGKFDAEIRKPQPPKPQKPKP